MLEIRVNNQTIDLFPETRLPVQEYSPIFDRDAIQRSFSFPFKIPATIRNMRILEHPTRIDGAGRRKYQQAELRIAGHQYEQGVLVITGSTRDIIEVAFKNEVLDLLDNLSNYRLRKDLGMNVSVVSGGYVPVIILRYDLTTYAGAPEPVYLVLEVNSNVYQVLIANAGNLIAQINADFPGVASVQFSDSNTFTIGLSSATKPDIQVNTVPALPGGTYYIYPTVDLSSTSYETFYLNVWKAHVQNANNEIIDTHRFPTIYAPNFYDGENDAYWGYVNYYEETEELYLPLRTLSQQAENVLVPMPRLRAVLENIFERAGELTISGSFFDDPDLAKLIVYNNRSVEQALSASSFVLNQEAIDNLSDYQYLLASPSFSIGDHLPDLTFYEFVTKLANMFPIVLQVKSSMIQIDTVASLLTNNIIDLTAYTLEEFQKRNTQYSGFELSYERYDTPEENAAYLQDYAGGTNEDQTLRIKSEFFTHYFRRVVDVNTLDEQGGGGRAWTLPIDPFPGYTLPGNSSSDIDLRLMFYFGLQDDSKGQDYPLASFYPADHAGTSLGPYSLDWAGEKGLYLNFWDDYIDLLTADEITAQFVMPVQKIIELKQNITAPVYVRHPQGSYKALIKKLSFAVGLSATNQVLVTATLAKF